MLRQMSSVTEASGSSVSEHVEERGGKKESKTVVFAFKPLGLNPPTVASSNQIVLVGWSPAHVFGAYHFETSM